MSECPSDTTGLSSDFYKDTVDYSIFCGAWCIGRIYEIRPGPADLRWFWALYAPSKPGGDADLATLEVAKAEFEASWKQWKTWAGWKRLANAQRRKCGRSLLYCFLSDPFGIGYFEIRVLQFQFVR